MMNAIQQADGDPRNRFQAPSQPRGFIVYSLREHRHIERADCPLCDGEGCLDCRSTGKELRRDDHFALDDDDTMPDNAFGEDAF